MKKFKQLVLVKIIILITIVTNNSFASGLGIYFPTWSFAGTGTIYYDLDEEASIDYNHFGGGIFFDSRLAANRIFNYRIALIYEKVTYDGSRSDNYFARFAVDQSFGFGILRNKNVRLWLGPQVRLAYMSWQDNNPTHENWRLGFGVAPMFGSNFHLGSVITLCLDIGVRSNFYYGEWKDSYTYNNFYEEESDNYYLTYYEIFLNFAVVFRFGDRY